MTTIVVEIVARVTLLTRAVCLRSSCVLLETDYFSRKVGQDIRLAGPSKARSYYS